MTGTLFEPVKVGPVTVPNRFVRSATWEGMCDPDGAPTPRLHELYEGLARGGVGLIISSYTFVRADGKQLPGKMGIDSDERIAALRRLVEAVHEQQGTIFCQLVHAGGQTSAKVIGTTPLAPSAVAAPNYPETPREMTVDDIRSITVAFAEGARRAREAGFDGIQLHGAHGYLINQFLSPLMNHRQDAYGGSLENRMRFAEEVFSAVRKSVGDDYPVTIKLTAADNLAGGFIEDEAVMVAKRLAELGIDAIEVSSGTAASGDASPVRQKIAEEAQEAYNSGMARRIRQAVDVPVMVVGGLRSPRVAQRLVEQSAADLLALSRPLIREPNLIREWRKGRRERATCISCNGCFRPGLKEGGIYCVVEAIERENRNPEI